MLGQNTANVTAAALKAGAGTYGGLHSYKFIEYFVSAGAADFIGNMSNMMWLSKNINAGKEIYSIGYQPGNLNPSALTNEIILIIEKGKEIIDYAWKWITNK